jgi:hypothetical protein
MEYSTFDIAKILEVKRSSLQQWMDHGFISPSIIKAEGRGTKSIFSIEDLYKIEIFRALYSSGLSQKYASQISQKIVFDWVIPGKFGLAYIEYNEFGKGGSKPVLHYIAPGAGQIGTGFLVKTFIDLPTIKFNVDWKIKEYESTKKGQPVGRLTKGKIKGK